MPPNYNNSKIYAIRSHQTNDVYIGSTVERLSARMSKHRYDYKKYSAGQGRSYVSSYEILKYPDAYIELLKNLKCLCKDELLREEGKLIRSTDNCVNKNIAGRTIKEYREDNAQMRDRQLQFERVKAELINSTEVLH